MLIATKDKYIKYLSPSCYGKIPDYRFFKQLFAPKVKWFENHCILVDSGFQGFGKDYQTPKLSLPQKRKKNGNLNLIYFETVNYGRLYATLPDN
jgi:hypothetical protein